MEARPSVSVLGLGLMGRPLARRLLAAGFDVRAWNRSAIDPRLIDGIPLCSDLADAARSDVCVLMLSDSAAVGIVLARLEPLLTPGRLVVDMGSSEPADSVARAHRLSALGIGWVDAPVSGGAAGAADGRLAIMAGGSDSDFSLALPVLEALGSSVVRVGPPGAGHTAKVANQLIVGLALEAVAEALAIVVHAGLDPRRVQAALRGGWADSRVFQEQGARMIEGEYEPGGKTRTLHKDLAMAQELATTLGLELPHLDSACRIFSAMVEQGQGELDCAAVYERVRVGG